MRQRTTALCVFVIAGACLAGLVPMAFAQSTGFVPLPFTVRTQVIHQQLSPDFCWFHPRVTAYAGNRSEPAHLLLTLQMHLQADDHYSGLWTLESANAGQSWSAPQEIPELGWQSEAEDVTVAVADCTPGWHAATGKVLVLGTKVRYSAAGVALLDKPGSHQLAYAAFDPHKRTWTRWAFLEMPDMDGKFYLTCPGCVQWLTLPNGQLLIPVYGRGPTGEDFFSTVLRCDFDGQALRYLEHGDELALTGGRGLVEPSLTRFQGRYYLTLRNDARGYVTTSEDGLHFGPLLPWAFDDGTELGSYNTQQHWLAHHRGLFLCYTRRGADNDHIFRHRAPLFVAQVDPQRLCVVRQTEQVLIPERGVPLGNFGAAAISTDASLVTDAEYLVTGQKETRGADGTVFGAHVVWSQPNLLAWQPGHSLKVVTLGDSITKGYRPGVTPEQTFSHYLQRLLQEDGLAVEVKNAGIGGETAAGALARLEQDVLSQKPDVVTVMYGTNDSWIDQGQTKPRVELAAFRRDLTELVRRIQMTGATVLLMTEPSYPTEANENGLGQHPNLLLEEYMDEVRAAAMELGLPLVDHYADWQAAIAAGTDVATWTTDRLHPNPQGHMHMARIMLPAVQESLFEAAQAKPE